MAKQLKFEYDGIEYTLEYTRKTVAQMEANGFIAREVDDKPMSTLPALFEGAFLAHHKWIKKEKVDEIYEHIPDKGELIGKLAEMYNEPIMSLVAEPENPEGNVNWTTNF